MYDVLIVGAGSAGAAVAARVSENPNWRVALVEAGPDYPLLAETPDDLVNSHNNLSVVVTIATQRTKSKTWSRTGWVSTPVGTEKSSPSTSRINASWPLENQGAKSV